MSANMNGPFNAAIRSAGNRSRALPPVSPIPNIGQRTTPFVAPTEGVQDAGPPPAASQMAAPASLPTMQTGPTPAAAPAVQPSTFTMHPPGTPADQHQYNYEPQADGSWRVYPPGVGAPQHTYQASLPRAASTGDFIRMSQAFRNMTQAPQQQPAPPTV